MPHLNAVLVMRGASDADAAFQTTIASLFTSFDHLAFGLEQATRELMAARPDIFDGEIPFQLYACGWSEYHNAGRVIGILQGETLEVQDLAGNTSPWGDGIARRLALQGISDATSDDFDPVRNGVALMEAQRAELIVPAGWGACHTVRGFAQLTTITRDCITTRVLKRWPDQIGQRIAA